MRSSSPLLACCLLALLAALGCGDDGDASADATIGAPKDGSLRDGGGDPIDAGRTLLDAQAAPTTGDASLGIDDHGTWVLAFSDADQAPIRAAFQRTSGALKGVSLQLGWDALDGQLAARLDPWKSLVSSIRLPDGTHPALSVQLVAGVHTPARVLDATGAIALPSSVGDGGVRSSDGGLPSNASDAGLRIPNPCAADGTPNVDFQREYLRLVDQLTIWCQDNDVLLERFAWFGKADAQPYSGPEAIAACDDQDKADVQSWNLLAAHERLFDAVLAYAKAHGIAIEFPLDATSGASAGAFENALAAYVERSVLAQQMQPFFSLQSQSWGSGDALLAHPEWQCSPLRHGYRVFGAATAASDWAAMYSALRSNNARYAALYSDSFTLANTDALVSQVVSFAAASPLYHACP